MSLFKRWAVDLVAWWLLRTSRRAQVAHLASLWYRDHDLGYEYLIAHREYHRLHRSYRKWLPLYTRLREIEDGNH